MNYALVLAGGQGERMGKSSVPKQFIELSGKPLIVYTLETIEKNKNIDSACVVAPVEWHKKIHEWCRNNQFTKIRIFAVSGKDRQQSVHNGLKEIKAQRDDVIMIMTAVCPFVSQQTINEHFEKIQTYNACITVVRAVDAITFSNNGLQASRTLQKSKMFVQQGPQSYKYNVIKNAHEQYDANEYKMEVNEDSELVLNMGVEVAMVPGDRFCLKVTYPEDIAIVEALKGLFDAKERNLR